MIRVFDDFLPDPAAYMTHARSLTYKSYYFGEEEVTFHGIAMADNYVPNALRRMYPGVEPTLSFFRRGPEGQVEPHFIHTDIDMGDWSAILYLNPTPPDNDGTVFWTHKESKEMGSLEPHLRSVEGNDKDNWELRERVPAKFNRMLLFDSRLYHSRAIFDNWGTEDDGRLTQVTFGRGRLF